MKLDESTEQPGFFWLPDQDEDRFPGTLRIEQTGHVYVDLFAALDISRDDPPRATLDPSSWASIRHTGPYERIHGLIKGEAITLDDCLLVTGNRLPAGGVSQVTLRVSRAYLGGWYAIGETPTFSRMVISIEGLHQWLLLSGLDRTAEHENGKVKKLTHSFVPPPEITANLPDGTELAFGLSWSESGIGPDATEATITQRADMVIRRESPVSLDNHLNISLIFQRLLSLAVNRSVDIISLTGYSTEFTRGDYEIPVEIYLPGGTFGQATQPVQWFRMLFTYPEVQDRFEAFVANWYERYITVGPAINLYDSLVSGGYRYMEGHFLATVQATEAFHRRVLPQRKQMPDEEFKQLRNDIAKAVPKERRQLVLSRLARANELSLRDRLEEMIQPFQDLLRGERDDFINDVVETRNRLAHSAVVKDSLIDDPTSLFRLQQKLEGLFQLHLLKLLGFTQEEIEEISKKEALKYKLR